VEITNVPLLHIGNVKAFGSKESFDLLQNTIDYLTCKAKNNMSFTDDEKEFMKELFEALWWGGQIKGYKEAAQLANHYVNGKGKTLKISEEVYNKAVIVQDVANAMKQFIKAQATKRLPVGVTKSSDSQFLRSTFASPLFKAKRNVNKQGYLLGNGALLAEQDNARLKNTDHRFYLTATTTRINATAFMTKWSVNSVYDFEPFASANYVTNIPVATGFILILPDGLSNYLTKISTAQDFKYFAEWNEKWQ
jgi:hypothetical protein